MVSSNKLEWLILTRYICIYIYIYNYANYIYIQYIL